MSEDSGSVSIGPHNLVAERALLGCLMLDNPQWFRVSGWLDAQDFYSSSHGEIWETVKSEIDAGNAIDPTTVCSVLEAKGKLEMCGGPVYVVQLEACVWATAMAERHAVVVLMHSLRRQIITLGQQLAEGGDDEVAEALARAQGRLSEIQIRADTKPPDTTETATQTVLEVLHQQRETDVEVIGTPTCIIPLDKMLGGLRPGNEIVVGAGTSVGKTSFALSIVERLSVRQNRPTIVFSLEMTQPELIQRLLSMNSDVPLERIRNPRDMWDTELDLLAEAGQRVGAAPVTIIDRAGISIEAITARALEERQCVPDLALIVVDYLQLVSTPSVKATETREREVTAVSRGLKALAMRAQVPVMVLAQFNRTSTKVKGPPKLADFRESGAIEQDADICLLLYRDHSDLDIGEYEPINCLVGKHRNGPTGIVELTLRRTTTVFTERTH